MRQVAVAGGIVIAALVLVWLLLSKPPDAASSKAVVASAATAVSSASTTPESSGTAGAAVQSSEEEGLLRGLREKLQVSLDSVLSDLAEIAKTRPALAIDLAQALGRTPQEKSEWVTNLTQQWADKDPQATWDWLRKLSSERMQELGDGDLTPVVLGAMAARDPKMVVDNMDVLLRTGNLSESVSTPVAVHVGLMALVEQGKIDLARGVVEGWAKDPAKLNIEAAAFETVAMTLAKTQPRETGEWLRSLPLNEERNAAIATFTATWAERDPRAALQWAEALPAAEGQHAALGRTVSDWIEQYPNEVSGWLGDYLSRVPPSAETDTLVETVINVSPSLRSTPQAALQWAKLISDPAKRTSYEEKVAVRWGSVDRAAAIDYVWKSATIPPERKSALVREIHNSEKSDL